jgi:FkbM family methyltransferase
MALSLSFSLFCNETYSLTDIYGIPFDHKLVQLFNSRGGVFVEVGAHDGITQSNTFLLEKNYDWTGVLVEPSPSLYEMLKNNRPHSQCYSCALGSFFEDGGVVTGDFYGKLMSSVKGDRLHKHPNQGRGEYVDANISVPVRALQSILDERALTHINLLSLDTEGYEFNILQGIDFDKTVFDYLLIEIYAWDYEKISQLLMEKGYHLLECFSNYDHRIKDWDGTHNDYLFKRVDLE